MDRLIRFLVFLRAGSTPLRSPTVIPGFHYVGTLGLSQSEGLWNLVPAAVWRISVPEDFHGPVDPHQPPIALCLSCVHGV